MRLGYLHLPRFPLQRRVREQPSLSGRPVLLHVEERGTQRVRFASGSALARGVRPGMAVSAASALEPEVVKLPFDSPAEASALGSLGEMLLMLAPGFQVAPPDGLWLDASAARLFRDESAWAEQVLAACRTVSLVGRCVVASERFTAQALARWGAEPRLVVEPRGELMSENRLACLPLIALEEGWLGHEATNPLRSLGLTTLGEVASMPVGALVARFGAMGHLAARLSRGEDDSGFVADALTERLEETVELDWPAEHLEPLLFAVKTVCDRLCTRLQGRKLAAVQLTATLGLEGGAQEVVPLRLARPTSQAKLLLELVRHRLIDLTVRQPIATLTIRVEESSPDPGRQLALGEAPAGEAELEVVLSRLQSALGTEALFSAEPVACHRPEAGWTATAFHPPDGGHISELWGVMETDLVLGTREGPVDSAGPELRQNLLEGSPSAAPAPEPTEARIAGYLGSGLPLPPKKRTRTKVEVKPTTSLSTLALRPPRLWREPSLLSAELTDDGHLTAVNLLGRRRRVEVFWGPERLCGEWWSADSFARDYYRVQLEGVGSLWVFRDGRDGRFYAQGVFD